MNFSIRNIFSTFYFISALILLLSAPAQAAVLREGFSEMKVAQGLNQPTAFAFTPDGRLLVCEKGGRIRIIKNPATANPQLVANPVYTVNVSTGSERGLLGIAVDPNFSQNNYVYIYYTVPANPPHNQISRITLSGDTVVSGSEQIILRLDPLSSATNHNGGGIHFGPDGKLYAGVGENATAAHAQNLGNHHGSLLRINPNGTVPADNPFVSQSGRRGEIWAYGLRNPFTFGIDPQSGKIFINDVGQNTWEEINEGVKGGSYGWPACEGSCTNSAYINPVHQYGRSVGSAITGGAFYRGNQFPSEYAGRYFFSDYTRDWIKIMQPTAPYAVSDFATGVKGAVDLRVSPDGRLYSLSIGTGEVYRYSYQSGGCLLKTQGDADCDGKIDLIDFEIWRKEFMGTQSGKNADFNNSGTVDLADFEVWRKGYFS